MCLFELIVNLCFVILAGTGELIFAVGSFFPEIENFGLS